jgi:hypothetical protein
LPAPIMPMRTIDSNGRFTLGISSSKLRHPEKSQSSVTA